MGGMAGGLFGGGGKNGGPRPPDFGRAAQSQAASSRNDIHSTFGDATWSQVPGSAVAAPQPNGRGFGGRLSAAVSRAAGRAAPNRWELNIDMADPLKQAAGNLMNQISAGSQLDPATMREQATDAAYRMQTSRLDPRFAQDRGALEARLANEGFSRGDAGWNTAFDEFNRSSNDAYQQAMLGAQSGAGNTAFAQSLAAAMQPYQQLGAIQGLGERAGYASLAGAQPSQDLAAASAQYQGDLQRYGIEQQGKNSMLGGLGSLGMLAMLGPGGAAAGGGLTAGGMGPGVVGPTLIP